MLIYRRGRFFYGDASFALPDNCFIVTNDDYPSENGFSIRPLDETFTINIDFLYNELGSRDGLIQTIEGAYENAGSFDVRPVKFIYSSGWEVSYPSDSLFSHDIWLDISPNIDNNDGECFNIFSLLISSRTCFDINSIKATDLFQSLVDNIRPGRVSLADDNLASSFVDGLLPNEVQRFQEISTQSLGLSPRELVLLIRADCHTLYDILRLGPKYLRRTRNCGRESYATIVHSMEKYGIDVSAWWAWLDRKPTYND